jgi:UDP-glucuronate decarboxylase
MKNILVAGGCGFIGSNFIRRNIANNKIICIDNFLTGSKDNLRSIANHSNLSVKEIDIIDEFSIDESLDYIVNFACAGSPPKYQIDPIHTIKTNTIGVDNLLSLALKNNAVFFQSSTSEVYGNPTHSPQNESYLGNVNCFGDRACYDEGKRLAETLCLEYLRKYDVDVRIARIFNTYGPYMDPFDGRVITNFLSQIIQKKPLTVYGMGEQTRSFCYIDDLLDGIENLIFNVRSNDLNSPINIGNPKEFTINELIQEISTIFNIKPNITFQDLPMDDPLQRKPDIEKAKKLLDFNPKLDLKTGLTKTHDYIKSIL